MLSFPKSQHYGSFTQKRIAEDPRKEPSIGCQLMTDDRRRQREDIN